MVIQITADLLTLPEHEVRSTDSVLALGADSFHLIELVIRLEQHFNVQMPHSFRTPGHRTVGDYASAVAKAISAAQNP